MVKNFRKVFGKVLDLPTSYTIPIALAMIVSIGLLISNPSNILGVIMVVIIGGLITLQAHLGTVVVKSVISGFIVMYTASLYTDLIMNTKGYVTQPFMITIASISLFLAQTYGSKVYTAGLRSRAFWSSVLAVLLFTFKSAAILSNSSYLVAEVVGVLSLVLFILAWRTWLFKSKKTKINKPSIIKSEEIESFNFIHIEDTLRFNELTWENKDSKHANAYPYIYNEVVGAREKGLTLVIVSEAVTNNLYNVGEVFVNKTSSIPYLYVEAKEKCYIEDIMSQFVDELNLRKCV